MCRPGGKNDFLITKSLTGCAVLDIFDTDGAATFDQDTGDMCASFNGEVLALPYFADQLGRPGTLPLIDIRIKGGDAFLMGAVIVGHKIMPRLLRGFEKGIFDRVVIVMAADLNRAVTTAIIISPGDIGFHIAEMRQYIIIAPACCAGGFPIIEILAVAADKDHAVDR